MIELLKKLVQKFIEQLCDWFGWWCKRGETPPEPPKPMPVPDYIEEMKRTHPGRSGEDFIQWVELTALENTHFLTPHIDRAGELVRNEEGNLICEKMKNTKPIFEGAKVRVYRWAFPVDSGVVRESLYHIEDKKGLIDIKKFSKPE
jgi:hypothetical protein